MIREFEFNDTESVDALGLSLSKNYDVQKCSEFEKILVYEKNSQILGFLQYRQLYEVVEVIYIVVVAHERNKGIGSSLFGEITKFDGVKRIILEVSQSNFIAIGFYKKLGFRIVREIKSYYSNGESAYAMEMVL